MNRIIKALVVVFAIVLSFVSNSCDKFDTFPLNIPFSVTIVTQGITPSFQNSNQYRSSVCPDFCCLDAVFKFIPENRKMDNRLCFSYRIIICI